MVNHLNLIQYPSKFSSAIDNQSRHNTVNECNPVKNEDIDFAMKHLLQT